MKQLLLITLLTLTGCTQNEKSLTDDSNFTNDSGSDNPAVDSEDVEKFSDSDTIPVDKVPGLPKDTNQEFPDTENKFEDSDTGNRDTADTNFEDSDTGDINASDTESELLDSDSGSEPADSDTAGTDDTDLCEPLLVINEIDYDMAGVDSSEFIEILNNSECPADLTDLAVILFNGYDNSEYNRFMLTDAAQTMPPHTYLLLAGQNVTVPDNTPAISIDDGTIQNGPDGIGLFNFATLQMVDSFCYEGELTAVTVTGVDSTFNLVRGELSPIKDNSTSQISLGRTPDGSNTFNASADWQITLPTPGASNTASI